MNERVEQNFSDRRDRIFVFFDALQTFKTIGLTKNLRLSSSDGFAQKMKKISLNDFLKFQIVVLRAEASDFDDLIRIRNVPGLCRIMTIAARFNCPFSVRRSLSRKSASESIFIVGKLPALSASDLNCSTVFSSISANVGARFDDIIPSFAGFPQQKFHQRIAF